MSTRIEGTHATMGEVLKYEAAGEPKDPDEDKEYDFQEILNYRKAIHLTRRKLKTIPLSGSLLKFAHDILMKGTRGQNRSPGKFRKIPNWIGPDERNMKRARFIPISADKIADGVSALEDYIHSDQKDKLVQLAIIHAEFEALHPFLDGNGRVGRLLIPLYLLAKKLLITPTFYMSAYLEANRDEYYDRLLAVSRDNDWLGWCAFFLRGLTEQAKSNANIARQIIKLYNDKKSWVAKHVRSQYAIPALDFIFRRPYFLSLNFVEKSGCGGPATARRILGIFIDKDMLTTARKGAGRRPAILVFPELLDIIDV